MDVWPKKILLATDGSEDAELAATTAVSLARITDSELHVVNVGVVAPALLKPLDVEPSRVEREVRRILDEQAEKIENLGGAVTHSHVRSGGAAQEIVELAEEVQAGLIALGSRGTGGVRRALMGSVSDSVARYAHCPVMVVRGKPVVFPAKILVATDGSEEAILAAKSAADLAVRSGSELHVIHVAEFLPTFFAQTEVEPAQIEGEARKLLARQVEKIEEGGADVAEAHFRVGEANKEIVTLAEEMGAGLVVMGSRGLGGVRRALMGSISDSVVRHAHCPVMVVRG